MCFEIKNINNLSKKDPNKCGICHWRNSEQIVDHKFFYKFTEKQNKNKKNLSL